MKGRGKVIFPPLQFLVTRMGPTGTPPLTPNPADGILGKLAEAWQKGKNSYQGQLSKICGAWWREEGKISRCPFLSKFTLAGKHIGYRYFPSQGELLPSCLSHFVP